jgi:hypothetical protein
VSQGGGMNVQDAEPHFSNCTWRGNTVTGSSGSGGGLYIGGTAIVTETAVFELCVFETNTAVSQGGGMNVQDAEPRFSNCMWRGNTVTGISEGGGGLYIVGTASVTDTAVFELCVFETNSAMYGGGGMYVVDAEPRFSNCTWRGNTATGSSGGVGGGL